MKIKTGCVSDVGAYRPVNQDAVFCRYLQKNGEIFALCAVCDGVGGLENGEVASGFLVDRMGKWFQEILSWIDISAVNPGILCSHLKDAVEEWNEELIELQRNRNIRTGTTMSLLMIIRQAYYIIHVGDSRIYRYREKAEQLTTDACVTRIEQGRTKNYLSNFMGKGQELWFQLLEGQVLEGDLFLLCSDGFYHCLMEEDFPEIDKVHGKEMVKKLIRRGERDNISAVFLKIEKPKKRLFDMLER